MLTNTLLGATNAIHCQIVSAHAWLLREDVAPQFSLLLLGFFGITGVVFSSWVRHELDWPVTRIIWFSSGIWVLFIVIAFFVTYA
jgi:hypothetical protein